MTDPGKRRGEGGGRCETDRASAPCGARRRGAQGDGQALIGGPRNEEGRAEAAQGIRNKNIPRPVSGRVTSRIRGGGSMVEGGCTAHYRGLNCE